MAVNDAVPAGRSPGRVKSADRTLLILEHLATVKSRRTLSQMHQSLGIPKSSLHALLQTMVARGWVKVDESQTLFGLGVRALLVGTAFIDTDAAVLTTRQLLDALAQETGETVHHGRLDGADIVYLATRQSVHELRMYSRVGRRLPAHTTALGKAILASRLDRFDELYPEGTELPRLTPHSITDLADLHRELEIIRNRGYSIDREENTVGVNCFAMALPSSGEVQDAVSLSIPLARLDPKRERDIAQLLEDYVGSSQQLDFSDLRSLD